MRPPGCTQRAMVEAGTRRKFCSRGLGRLGRASLEPLKDCQRRSLYRPESAQGHRPMPRPQLHHAAAPVVGSSAQGDWVQLKALRERPRSLLGRRSAGKSRTEFIQRGEFRTSVAKRFWAWAQRSQAAALPLPVFPASSLAKPTRAEARISAAATIGQRLMKAAPPFYRVQRAGAPRSPGQWCGKLLLRPARTVRQSPHPPSHAWHPRRSG